MKKEELSIGDWVYVAHQHSNIDGDYDLEFIPEKLTLEHFKFWAENDWDNNDFDESLKPILLTPEILEKNGFMLTLLTDRGNEYYVEDDNYNYLRVFYCDTWFEIGNSFDEEGELQAFADIQFVHELQHALRLCKIEKEIKL